MQNRRVCFIEVETEDNGKKELKRLEGLAIRGTVNRKAGSMQSDAKLSVANLTQSDVEFLTTFTKSKRK